MVRILHLLSQNHLTGAEVYAATLALEQKAMGYSVFQISNGFFYPTDAVKTELEVETKSKVQFLKNVFWMRSYLQKNEIAVLHSHSRASAKLAYWATVFTPVAFVSTVHGEQHASLSKQLFNQYGQFLIAVCENIQNHLQADFGYRAEQLKVIRNPINQKNFYFLPKVRDTQKLKIAVIGRTTGPKKERTEQTLQALLNLAVEMNLNLHIEVVGGSKKDLALPEKDLSQIVEVHTATLTTKNYSLYDLVIGSGRVCMESILSGIPCVAFGEAQYIGLIRNAHFTSALRSNFGDIDLTNKNGPNLNRRQFKNDILTLLNGELSQEELRGLAEKAAAEFSTSKIASRLERIYQSAIFLKKYPYVIPVLMYHKIPEVEIKSQHKIFVLKENFEKHLQFFKKNKFQTLTFSELEKFRKNEKDFSLFPKKPLLLTFDDGYRDNLDNASPLLEKYGFRAQIFLLANFDIQNNVWDASETEPSHDIISGKERQKWLSSAFEIGSHGFSHDKITKMSTDQAFLELSESKMSLEKEFDQAINVFAFTYGDTDSKSAALAEAAGYQYAVNTDHGGFRIEESPYEIFRANIFPDETNYSLWKKTSRWYRRYYYWKRKK